MINAVSSHDDKSEKVSATMFAMLPHKLERKHSKNSAILWPECGSSFELNIFYIRHEACGREIGEGCIFFWSAKEIKKI